MGYKQDLHETLESARNQLKPVKVTNLLSKFDQFKNKVNFTLNNYSSVEYSNHHIPLDNIKPRLETINLFTSLKEAQEKIDPNTTVNVVAYTTM